MELPGIDRIGFTLDLTKGVFFNMESVVEHLLTKMRLISIDFNDVRDVVLDGVTYSVPRAVAVPIDAQTPRGEYISFPDGPAVVKAFMSNPYYPLRYLPASGSTSVVHAAQRELFHDSQYAFFNYKAGSYSARLQGYSNSLDEKLLIGALNGVPTPFNPSDDHTVRKYRDFFRQYGSHVIHGASYGAEYNFWVCVSNEYPQVNEKFDANVKAKFNGIPSNGYFDASVKNEEQYKRFLEYLQTFVSVVGGEAENLIKFEATYDDLLTWIASIKENVPRLMGLRVVEIWTLMKFAESLVLQSYADPLCEAFMWIIDHK